MEWNRQAVSYSNAKNFQRIDSLDFFEFGRDGEIMFALFIDKDDFLTFSYFIERPPAKLCIVRYLIFYINSVHPSVCICETLQYHVKTR